MQRSLQSPAVQLPLAGVAARRTGGAAAPLCGSTPSSFLGNIRGSRSAGSSLRGSRGSSSPMARPLQRAAALTVLARSGGGGGGRRRSGSRPAPLDPTALAKEYALPALGLLVAASLVGPLIGGLVFGALSLGVMIAAGAAFLSVSWVAVPLLVAVFGLPALWAGGMAAGVFATIAGGALLLPSLFQLVLVGGGLWLGANVAQRLFYGGGTGAPTVGPDGTIDVEAETVDDWREEMFKEQREREAELREFDDLLRRRDEFKKGGGPRY